MDSRLRGNDRSSREGRHRADAPSVILANAGIHPLGGVRQTQRACGSSSQRVVKQAERLPDFMPQRGAVPQTPVRKVLRP